MRSDKGGMGMSAEIRILAGGLGFPEGPVAMPDGSVILTEINGGRITRVAPDGAVTRLGPAAGGPNGLARGPDGNVSALRGTLNLAGDVKATKRKLTWLADTKERVAAELVDYEHLLTQDKVEEGDELEEILTPKTEFVYSASGEAALRGVAKGQIIQVERRGYYICDRPYLRPADPIRLIYVPDGKSMMGVNVPHGKQAK